MTTARERAREAVRPELAGLQLETSNHAADAASDIWEPIIQALVDWYPLRDFKCFFCGTFELEQPDHITQYHAGDCIWRKAVEAVEDEW